MSSSPETTTRTTGAHRAHREARDHAAARAVAQRPSAFYEPYLDGLFTYCLSVLCDHDTATSALGDVLTLAERRGQRVRGAADERRAWLYALARWACLRQLAEARQKRPATHAAGRPVPERHPVPRPAEPSAASAPQTAHAAKTSHAPSAVQAPSASHASSAAASVSAFDAEQQRRRRELAQLAWPEAAGTTPKQREALELAVRHHLAAHEVAAVLGTDLAATRDLLASAACEVERTRAALAVVETGTCPGVARLTGSRQLVLNTAVRRELVRHVDDCPRCRRAAERAMPGRWPGASVTPAELPVLEAPRAALHRALAHHPRARGAAAPRFDRRGFPMDPKDRAARRDRLRARAVTTTVVATVMAAPVLALWAAYRGSPAEQGPDGPAATAHGAHDPDRFDGSTAGGYQNAGNTDAGSGGKGGSHAVAVRVVGVNGTGTKSGGRLAVSADNAGDTTLVTLSATGPGPVSWSASTTAHWLYLSRSSGTLNPGESVTVKIYVDHLREPSGSWRAQVAVAPAGAVVTIDGYGTAPSGPADPVDPPATASPNPTGTSPSTGSPAPGTSTPPADPTTGPTDPPTSEPPSSPPPATESGAPGPHRHHRDHRRHR